MEEDQWKEIRQKDRGSTEKLNLMFFMAGNAGRKKHSGWGVRSHSIHGFGNWFRALHKSFKLHPQFLCLQETIMLFGIDRWRCHPMLTLVSIPCSAVYDGGVYTLSVWTFMTPYVKLFITYLWPPSLPFTHSSQLVPSNILAPCATPNSSH